MRYKYWIGIGSSIILGLIFVAAGVGKLLDQGGALRFKVFFTPFIDLLTPAFIKTLFIWLPWIELIIGLLLIIGIAAKLMAVFSSALIVGFIANNSWLLSRGLGYEPCDCFGILEIITQAKLSTVGSLYLDIVMLALALVILFCCQSNFLNIYPWLLTRGRIGKKKDWSGSG